MKKLFLSLLVGILVVSLTGCGTNDTTKASGKAFKEDYESVNGKENASGKIHRTISIPEDNVFVMSSASEVLKKINNKDSFYVFFGSKLCPWCRSTIEKANEVAIEKGVSKIYYVDIWDSEGNEILRDKYKLDDNNKPVLEKEGAAEYQEFLKAFDSLLTEYTLTDKNNNKISVGEKRIYAPNYVYIENGVAKKLVTGISEKQKDSREELTDEILADEEQTFNNFFTEVCREAC